MSGSSNRKLIVGLGNTGGQYDNSRHNTGFFLLDFIAKNHAANFQEKPKFKSYIAELSINNQSVILLKPTTFYNLSGEAVRVVSDFYKIAPEDTLVIHDELALPFGTVRTRIGGSDAGNNGIKSINQHMGGQFARIRTGILNDLHERTDDAAFVLNKFSREENEKLQKELAPKVGELVQKFIAGDFPHDTHKL